MNFTLRDTGKFVRKAHAFLLSLQRRPAKVGQCWQQSELPSGDPIPFSITPSMVGGSANSKEDRHPFPKTSREPVSTWASPMDAGSLLVSLAVLHLAVL